MASLKTEADKLDTDKLLSIPVDQNKLSDVVKIDFVKKTECNILVTKFDSIDTTNFVKKMKYERNESEFENQISKIDKKNT